MGLLVGIKSISLCTLNNRLSFDYIGLSNLETTREKDFVCIYCVFEQTNTIIYAIKKGPKLCNYITCCRVVLLTDIYFFVVHLSTFLFESTGKHDGLSPLVYTFRCVDLPS